jgi:hypothetical protein
MRIGMFAAGLFLLLTSCNDDTEPPSVVQGNVANDINAVLVDDTLGIACFQRTSVVGKTVTVTTEACQPASNIPTLTSSKLRRDWRAVDADVQILIDDTNSLLCIREVAFYGCMPQSQVNQDGLAALRSRATAAQ